MAKILQVVLLLAVIEVNAWNTEKYYMNNAVQCNNLEPRPIADGHNVVVYAWEEMREHPLKTCKFTFSLESDDHHLVTHYDSDGNEFDDSAELFVYGGQENILLKHEDSTGFYSRSGGQYEQIVVELVNPEQAMSHNFSIGLTSKYHPPTYSQGVLGGSVAGGIVSAIVFTLGILKTLQKCRETAN